MKVYILSMLYIGYMFSIMANTVFRHNGSLANGDKGRRRSRLALYKRPKANGVKPDVIHNVSTPLVSKVRGHIIIRQSSTVLNTIYNMFTAGMSSTYIRLCLLTLTMYGTNTFSNRNALS